MRYLVLQGSISSFIILCSSTFYVTGQPVLTTGVANCGDDVKLTCSQPGFDVTLGRSWKKGDATISDRGKDASGTDRYSEKSTSNDFSLVISNAILADAGDYKCDYNFNPSNVEPLSFECKPIESGVEVSRNNQKKLFIQVNNIYPHTVTIAVACALQGNNFVAMKGTPGTPTQNGDHFDITWTSDDTISAGTYNCAINVVTMTPTEIVKNELTFADPVMVNDKTDQILGLRIGVGLVSVFAGLCVFILIYLLCVRNKDLRPELDQEKRLRNKAETRLKESEKIIKYLERQVQMEKKEVQDLKKEAEDAKSKIAVLRWQWGYEKTLRNTAETRLKESAKRIEDLDRQMEKNKVPDLKKEAEDAKSNIAVWKSKWDQEQQQGNTAKTRLKESEKRKENLERQVQIGKDAWSILDLHANRK